MSYFNSANKKVIVGMSGGVDSTVSVHLLQKEGFEVVGVSMLVYETRNAQDDIKTAKEMAKRFNIKHIEIDKRVEFKEKIINRFVDFYEHGLTPNPCSICNGVIKFKMLLDLMEEEKGNYISTGHYANVVKIGDRFAIKKSSNEQKDQSYMLYNLKQEQLKHIIFPIGNLDKTEVRKIAKELNLSVHEKKDSQDICFIKDIDYVEFIKRYEFGNDYREKIASGKLNESEIQKKDFMKKGAFVDKNKNILGYHNGIINYTIGQRKGLNIALGDRKYVLDINSELNEVTLGDNTDLFSDEIILREVNEQLGTFEDVICKVRYRHDGTKVKNIIKNNDHYIIKLEEPVRAITKGQAAVFYKDDVISFGGVIY